MIAEGAGPYIINGAQTGDVTTQQACCAVLSIISSHEQCRGKLCEMDALPALIKLANMNDMKTRLRCAVALDRASSLCSRSSSSSSSAVGGAALYFWASMTSSPGVSTNDG